MTEQERKQYIEDIKRHERLASEHKKSAVLLEQKMWREIRETTASCGDNKHDIEQIFGSVFTVYRCNRCGDEEWI